MDIETFTVFIVLFVLVVLLSYVISAIAARAFRSEQGLRLFITPGVAVHEYSHALACVLTGARISEINLFAKNGGYVRHSEPRLRFIGPPLISIAPVIGGTIFLYALTVLFSWYIYIPTLGGATAIDILLNSFYGFVSMVVNNATPIGVPTLLLVLYLYLTLSIAAAIAPSAQDFKNSAALIFLLGFISVLIIYYPPLPYLIPAYSGPATPILDAIIGVGLSIVSTALVMEIFAIVVMALIFLPIIYVRK